MAAFLVFFVMLLFTEPGFARDLGSHGKTYEIQEEDLKQYLEKRLKAMSMEERSILEAKMYDFYRESYTTPKAVEGLKRAKAYAVRYMDPTVRAREDIRDHEGNVIVRRGEIYNPLERIRLEESLVFFDGMDAKQVAWARGLGHSARWVLVRGRPLELERAEGRPVYFDQGASLVRHFGITCLPTEISQDGAQFKIEEVKL